MAFNVRIFGYRGLDPFPILDPKQATVETVYALAQPYIFRQTLSVSGTAVSSIANNDVRTTVLRIEIPDGQAVRYEVNSPNRSVTATTDSPILSGRDQILWGRDYTISMIDASGLP